MAEFLVEIYSPRAAVAAAAEHLDDVSLAAEQVSARGERVTFVRAIFVPEDETCFYLYRARSAEAVSDAAARAGLEFARIAEAVSRTPHQEVMQ